MKRRRFLGLLPLATVGAAIPAVAKTKEVVREKVVKEALYKLKLKKVDASWNSRASAHSAQRRLMYEADRITRALWRHKRVELDVGE